MKEIIHSRYFPYFFSALLLNGLAAWFSLGFYHLDEHFQVLEFASYKLGNITPDHLPWEFAMRIRASLLPDLVYLLSRLLGSVGLYNPFTVAFLLRLFTGLAAWFIICRMCLLLVDDMKTEKGKKLFVLMSMFMWFIPALNVRFSSENISGICFLYGLYPLLKYSKEANKRFVSFAIAGFFFGFACFIRIQILIALAGLILWLILRKKALWKNLGVLAATFIVAVVINYFADWWFYGERVFTPYGYYYSNIILHKAAEFGTNPVWFYLSEFIIKGVPPLSVILLFLFLTGIAKNLKNPAVWIVVPVIAIHSVIGHKELRFLFSIAFLFLYIASLGLDYLLSNRTYLKWHKYVYAISIIIIIPLLARSVFLPAETTVSYSKYLYNNVSARDNIVFILKPDVANDIVGPNSSFYNSPMMKEVIVNSEDSIGKYMQANQIDSAFYMGKNNSSLSVNGFTVREAYYFFPFWTKFFDINQWEERTSNWAIYRIAKEK